MGSVRINLFFFFFDILLFFLLLWCVFLLFFLYVNAQVILENERKPPAIFGVMKRWTQCIRLRKFSEVSPFWRRCNQFVLMSTTISDFVDILPNTVSESAKGVLGVTRNTPSGMGPFTRLGLTPELSSADKSRSFSRSSSQSTSSVPLGSLTGEDKEVQINDPSLVTLCPKESLPFDDEEFAEKLLEMEVEGAIDECWQDEKKAYFEDVKEIAKILEAMKVRNICCVNTSQKTSNFDFIMFGTCEGQRHIHLASWAIQESDRVHRISKVKRKKTDETWEVVPVGRILVNLMTEDLRKDLSLERKWAVTTTMDPLHVANAPVSEGRLGKAHGLWSLTLNLQDLEDFEIDYCKDTLLKQL